MDSNSFEYRNHFGVLFNDCFIINNIKNTSPFRINETKKIFLYKKRRFRFNYSAFLLITILFAIAFLKYNIKVNIQTKLFFLMLISSLVLFALFFKEFKYFLIVLYRDDDPIKFVVDKKNKNEAKIFLKKVNAKIYKLKSIVN